jgi:arabinogalactan oligomer / maltooligosaccharide transport system substrate-binding protein
VRRRDVAFCLGAAGLAGLAGCAPRAAGTDTLVLWHAYRGREEEALSKAIALFNSRPAPGHKPVRMIAVPADALADKISAAVPRGKGPDLFIFPHERMGGWVESGETIASLDFFLEPADRARFLPGLLTSTTYKGVTYALPLNFKSIALFYNKALVPTPPRTTDELARIARPLTNQARGRFGFAYPFDDFFFHAALQNGYGGGVFDPLGRLILESPGNVIAAKRALAWKTTDQLLPEDPTTSLIVTLFNQGRVGMMLNGPWFLGEINRDLDFGVAVLPGLSDAGGAPMRPWMTVEALYVSAGARDPAAAFAFAQFMTGREAAGIMAREGGQLASNAALYGEPDIAADPIIQAFKDQALTAQPTPNIPAMTLVWSVMDKGLKRIMKAEATPEAALRDAQLEVEDGIRALQRSGGQGV